MKRATYRVPMSLALVTIIGLVFALVGDGPWDVASWILLTVPLAVIAKKWSIR